MKNNFDIYIGNYESVIGRNAYIKEKENFIPCKIIGYLFNNRKYKVITSDKRSFEVKNIYISY